MEIKPNNIYCGDSYDLIKSIPDKSVDLIYTDIPYQIQSGGGGGSSEISKRIQKINKVELKDISNGIDYSILDEFVRVLKRIYIYIYCSKEQMLPLMEYFIKKHIKIVNGQLIFKGISYKKNIKDYELLKEVLL